MCSENVEIRCSGVQVEKVMDHKDVPDDTTGEITRQYRVKWKDWSHLHNLTFLA